MQMSAILCREQAALQRAKAVSEPLENRRQIALVAATAWEAEAVWAEKRGANRAPLDKLDAAIALQFANEVEEDEADTLVPDSTH